MDATPQLHAVLGGLATSLPQSAIWHLSQGECGGNAPSCIKYATKYTIHFCRVLTNTWCRKNNDLGCEKLLVFWCLLCLSASPVIWFDSNRITTIKFLRWMVYENCKCGSLDDDWEVNPVFAPLLEWTCHGCINLKERLRLLELIWMDTLRGTNISDLWKRKIIFNIAFAGDMLVTRRVWYVCIYIYIYIQIIHVCYKSAERCGCLQFAFEKKI